MRRLKIIISLTKNVETFHIYLPQNNANFNLRKRVSITHYFKCETDGRQTELNLQDSKIKEQEKSN